MLRLTIFTCLVTIANGHCNFVPDKHNANKLNPGDITVTYKTFTFSQARFFCIGKGGRLKNIDTKEKYDELTKCLRDINDRMLESWTSAEGVDGQWRWQNGMAVEGEWCIDGDDYIRRTAKVVPNAHVIFSRRSMTRGCYTPKKDTEKYSALCEYYDPLTTTTKKPQPQWDAFAVLISPNKKNWNVTANGTEITFKMRPRSIKN